MVEPFVPAQKQGTVFSGQLTFEIQKKIGSTNYLLDVSPLLFANTCKFSLTIFAANINEVNRSVLAFNLMTGH